MKVKCSIVLTISKCFVQATRKFYQIEKKNFTIYKQKSLFLFVVVFFF